MSCQIHVTESDTIALHVVQSFFNLTQYDLTQHCVQPDTAATLVESYLILNIKFFINMLFIVKLHILLIDL